MNLKIEISDNSNCSFYLAKIHFVIHNTQNLCSEIDSFTVILVSEKTIVL